MDIDLAKPNVIVSDDIVRGTLVTGDVLRSRIRELISSFYARPRPVMPSEAAILNDYLLNLSPNFVAIRNSIAELSDQLLNSKPGTIGHMRIERTINEQWAHRDALVAKIVESEDFLKFRSDAKKSFNTMLHDFEHEESVISELKPFLGMPCLPSIEAERLTADYILSYLNNVKSERPLKGQMVLQMDEDIYSRPQFTAKSVASTGINKSLLMPTQAIPVPFALSDSISVKALAAGAFQRGRRVFFPTENGLPISNPPWSEIDRFLPFAFRSLTVPQLPLIEPTCSRFNFKDVFKDRVWEQISDEILEKHAHTCLVCGDNSKTTVHPIWRFREPVNGSFSPGVQILEDFTVFCPNCSDVFRPSLSSLLNKSGKEYVLSVDDHRKSWLKIVNRWNQPLMLDYARDAYLIALNAYRRRSKYNWIVDISKQRSLYFRLEDKYSVSYDGWITSSNRTPFKIVGAPFFEGTTRTFFQAPSIYGVPWGSNLEEVAKLLEQNFNLSTVDRQGSGAPKVPVIETKSLSNDDERIVIDDIEGHLSEETTIEMDKIESSQPENIKVDTNSLPSKDVPYDEDDDITPAPDYESIPEDEDEDVGFPI